ncbi:KdsC family phosphatase [Limnoglobus roseus]|uniref:Haloacid dehalogenase n=1 Tax=Limnoglobus roseus TaxID=2598579 RepID=A0A5C1AA07_9BACT|nr:HAD hydrolase family protein [Limnoglobus roseus]QEL13954.1 haloacid dehalogenase [Limnoglobus roseus]
MPRFSPTELAGRAKQISLLVLDVDGVLTDGRIVYADGGSELKQFHVRDGSGLKFWRESGNRAAIISGRASSAVDRRAKELGVGPVIQGSSDKSAALDEVLKTLGVWPQQVCAIGDDLPDLPMLRRCGLAVTVADACREVRAAADYVTQLPGGHGAVREAIEWLLTLKGQWGDVVKQYTEK